eukprot:1142871-Pelagomonas_calceolata.AAC.9
MGSCFTGIVKVSVFSCDTWIPDSSFPIIFCVQQLADVGAICSRRAAELYGLSVMAEGVQDVKDNITRFIVLSR